MHDDEHFLKNAPLRSGDASERCVVIASNFRNGSTLKSSLIKTRENAGIQAL
ncbi:MAG: hypothetical protein LBT46_11365 [Planctomycetaceae bacterium]|jgi:hypothetical protein|nr:hypothetical protein [Planctomycetaceae bacterium]